MKKTFIITAGGIGKRMGSDIPKQFISVAGKPILLHTMERFHSFDPTAQMIITLPADWHQFWKEILVDLNCTIQHELVEGGKERFHSIQQALTKCEGELVFIHDGVRPLVSAETLQRCEEGVIKYGTAVPVLPLKESLRKIVADQSQAVRRDDYCAVQTPQCFRFEMLKSAYSKDYHDGITDDAGLVEEAGFPIHLVQGNEENIKVTTALDLEWLHFLMTKR